MMFYNHSKIIPVILWWIVELKFCKSSYHKNKKFKRYRYFFLNSKKESFHSLDGHFQVVEFFRSNKHKPTWSYPSANCKDHCTLLLLVVEVVINFPKYNYCSRTYAQLMYLLQAISYLFNIGILWSIWKQHLKISLKEFISIEISRFICMTYKYIYSNILLFSTTYVW